MSNAVKAQSWWPRFLPARTYSGAPPATIVRGTAASQTISVGDPVTIASNVITKAVGTGGSASSEIYGVAAEKVVTTAANEGTQIAVWVANDDTIFAGRCDARSDTRNDTDFCDIVSSGSGDTGTWKVDVGTQSTNVVTIVEHVQGDDQTDTTDYGRVYFMFGKSSFLQKASS